MIFPLLIPPAPRPATFVLDVSVAAAWVIPRRSTLYTNNVQLKMSTAVVVVPTTWSLDLTEHLLTATQRGEITPNNVDRLLGYFLSFRIYADDEGSLRAWPDVLNLARAHNISVRDAAYLELSLRTNLPLATIDPTLTRAANAAGVPIFTP